MGAGRRAVSYILAPLFGGRHISLGSVLREAKATFGMLPISVAGLLLVLASIHLVSVLWVCFADFGVFTLGLEV